MDKVPFTIVYNNTEEGLRKAAILREKLKEKKAEFTEEIDEGVLADISAYISTEPLCIFDITETIFDKCFESFKYVDGAWYYEMSPEEEAYLEKLRKETMKRATYDPDDHDYGDEDQNDIMQEINHCNE